MYLRETDHTPYYIGKGTGRRAYVRQRVTPRPEDELRICILKENLTSEEALNFETKLIAYYGRKDIGTGILRNMTDGGDGASGRTYQFTEEHKAKLRKPKNWSAAGLKKISDTNSGRPAWNKGIPMSAEQKEKLLNANLGKTRSLESRRKQSESSKGHPGVVHTDVTKKRLSELNKNIPKKLCPCCNKMMSNNGGNFKRHYNSCINQLS